MGQNAPLRCKVQGEWGGSAHYPDPTAQSVRPEYAERRLPARADPARSRPPRPPPSPPTPHPAPPPPHPPWLVVVGGWWLVGQAAREGWRTSAALRRESLNSGCASSTCVLPSVVCPGHRHPADPAIASASCVARSPGAVAIAPRTLRFSPTSTLLLLSGTATVAPRYAPGLPIPSPLRGPAILMVLGPPRGCNVYPRSEGGLPGVPRGVSRGVPEGGPGGVPGAPRDPLRDPLQDPPPGPPGAPPSDWGRHYSLWEVREPSGSQDL